jgi:hypothetical protein
MSGSRGDANFVFKCKNCKVAHACYSVQAIGDSPPKNPPGLIQQLSYQRESSATIKEAPKPYVHSSPPQKANIIEFDCRGLEFTEFRAEVNENSWVLVGSRCLLTLGRVAGKRSRVYHTLLEHRFTGRRVVRL